MTDLNPLRPVKMVPLMTDRLILRCVEGVDAEATSRLMSPSISQWLAFWPSPFSTAMAQAVIADMRDKASCGIAAPYAVVLQNTRELIGWVVLNRDPQQPRRAALGYWIGQAYQQKGYAREAVAAALKASFSSFDVRIIEAAAQKDNQRSFAVMTACGMRHVGERLVYAPSRSQHEPCNVYEVTKSNAGALLSPRPG